MTEVSVLLEVKRDLQPFLTVNDRQGIARLIAGWTDAALTVRIVRGRKMGRLPGLFDEFAAALQFPLHFGENMAAFDDCISELENLPRHAGFVIVIAEPDVVLAETEPDQLAWLMQSLRVAAGEWAEPVSLGEWWDRPAIPFHVVLAAETSTEADRAMGRWTAAGAALQRLT